MVVDRYDGVHILLAECTHQVVGTFLHLGVGTLNGIQFDAIAITTRINRRYGTTTEADAVIITTDHDHLVAFLGLFFQTVALRAVTNTTSQHDDFVVSVFCRVES